MSSLAQINGILDGMDMILGGKSALKADGRMSLKNLRTKQGEGLSAVSVSMARIARPILAESLREVREAKKKRPHIAAK